MTRLLLLLALLSGPARAEPTLLSRVTVGLDSTANLSLTPGRTQGGLGGGVQVGFLLDAHWLVQARAAWLVGLGSHSLFHLGGAWQRSEGTWRPAFGAHLVLGLGGALDFSVGGRLPSRAPTLGLVASVALLRFQAGPVVLSALAMEGGVSTEFLSVGPRFGLTAFSLSAPLE